MTFPIIQEYTPSKPNLVFGPSGFQKIIAKSNYTFYSKIKDTIPDLNINNRMCVDNSWNSSNIYISNNDKIYKLDRDGTVLASVDLVGASNISVIQGKPRADGLTAELGIWVYSSNYIYKYDTNLVQLLAIGGINALSVLSSTFDGGCYIADSGLQIIAKVDTNGIHESLIEWNEFSPVISSTNQIIDLKVDRNGTVFVLSQNYIYRFDFNENGATEQRMVKGLGFLNGTTYTTGCFDLDRWIDSYVANESSSSFSEDSNDIEQYIYIASGDYDDCKIAKLDRDGNVISSNSFLGYGYPILLKTGQSRYSDAMFLLTNKDKFTEFSSGWESSSSSSSSSSIDPGFLYAVSTQTSILYKINTDSFDRVHSSHHLVYGAKAAVYDRPNSKLYYLSYYNDNIYYFDINLETNVLVGSSSITSSHRLCLSPNNQYLWISNESDLHICNKTTGAVLQAISLKGPSDSNLGLYGGMDIDALGQYLYICTDLGVWRTLASNITIGTSLVYFEFVGVNPSVTSNYLTGITFSNDNHMFVTDYVGTTSRLFEVNLTTSPISYNILNVYSTDILEDITGGFAL